MDSLWEIEDWAVEYEKLEGINETLLEALGRLVSKPVPFCDEGGSLVCPYCDCTEHPDDCDWLLAQQVWAGERNRRATRG